MLLILRKLYCIISFFLFKQSRCTCMTMYIVIVDFIHFMKIKHKNVKKFIVRKIESIFTHICMELFLYEVKVSV